MGAFLEQIEILVPGAAPRRLGPKDRAPLAPQDRLDSQAMRWSYVLRNRERWLGRSSAGRTHEDEARQTLANFGLDEAALAALAQAPCVVVRMPFDGERSGWEGRIFPWEYVIAAATRRLRQGRPCTVLRELVVGTVSAGRAVWPSPERAKRRAPLGMLFVQSAPAGLRDAADFDPEYERMTRALGSTQVARLVDPTLAQLREQVLALRPDIIHLTGFGNASGLKEWHELAGPSAPVELYSSGSDGALPLRMRAGDEDASVPDGMLLAGVETGVALVSAEALAQALSAGGGHCAYCISASLDSSAARTAPLLVAERAGLSAIGFQGSVDNALLDLFFELFYKQLSEEPWHAPQAFQRAWLRVRQEPAATRATGIAFWAGASLTEAGRPAPAALKAAVEPPDEDRIPRLNSTPVTELNYAVLHNRVGNLFTQLELVRGRAREHDWLGVDVELQLGAESARYSRRLLADKRIVDLAEDVVLPLTASLMRSVQEAVNSTLVVQLSWNEQLLSRETRRLRLLPVDQWRDNAIDGKWLPSFVLPRDAAVLKAVEQAQRYVRVLRDNPAAGFEGYQAAPSTVPGEDELCEVDLQVQAIWATLLHDWQLGYINPPPSYSSKLDSQRLRTPSTILANRSGTCIDLALLFAACLELIDIYPVIFLLKGHALVGYWRHNSFNEDYRALRAGSAPGMRSSRPQADETADTSTTGADGSAWQAMGERALQELRPRIEARQLVPIETVRLTEYCSFVEAIEAGIAALSEPEDFHSVLDIVAARYEGVTPLPIQQGPGVEP